MQDIIVDDKIADRIDGDVAGSFEETRVEHFALINIIGTSGLRSRSREEVSSARLPRNELFHWTKPNSLPAKTGRNQRLIQLSSIKRTGPEKTPLIWTQRKWEDGNETAFTHGCISSTRLRGDFSSDKVDHSNAAFRRRRGRLEMQQIGVYSNHLRAQPRCPLHLDELTSSGRPGMSESALSAKDCRTGEAKVIGVQAIRLIVEEA
jgi:hypothetical protein